MNGDIYKKTYIVEDIGAMLGKILSGWAVDCVRRRWNDEVIPALSGKVIESWGISYRHDGRLSFTALVPDHVREDGTFAYKENSRRTFVLVEGEDDV